MEYQNINKTLNSVGKHVIGTYATIPFDESSSNSETSIQKNLVTKKFSQLAKKKDEWISPSDLLIGTITLVPPFTSRITRGKTHEGILDIGNLVLENERSEFLKLLTNLVHDNDDSWNYILIHEKEQVIKKVTAIFENVFKYKSEIMKNELSKFYEESLQDLERYIKTETYTLLETAYAHIVSDLNNQIHNKMEKERKKLEKLLNKKYIAELLKVKKYYNLLLNNEEYRRTTLINKAMQNRNEAIKVFYKQIEARRLTSTMYIMSLERKKINVRKLRLKNLQAAEIIEKVQKIKNSRDLTEKLKTNNIGIARINKQWETKIKNILKLFLKFISFSLKLLPEQSNFLLDLQEMVVLQLQEIKKNSEIFTSVLITKKSESNLFRFEKFHQEPEICEEEPFTIIGDLSDSIPPVYGSRETLPSDVDLTYFRLQRQYVYAKCHGFETIKQLLESQKCQCRAEPQQESSHNLIEYDPKEMPQSVRSVTEESSLESLVLDDFPRLENCPFRKCRNWIEEDSFPYLASYLDYTEENFKRVTAILPETAKKHITLPDLISAKNIAYSELPFSVTKESHRNTGTQYSSQEDLKSTQISCPCIENLPQQQTKSSDICFQLTQIQDFAEIETKRKKSLDRLIREHPEVLKIFTDECYDYKL